MYIELPDDGAGGKGVVQKRIHIIYVLFWGSSEYGNQTLASHLYSEIKEQIDIY